MHACPTQAMLRSELRPALNFDRKVMYLFKYPTRN
jgi:hypothetical protein